MTTERTTLTARLLSDVSEYLDSVARELECSHSVPPDGRVSEPSIRDEIKRVRGWASKLRRAALQEVTR